MSGMNTMGAMSTMFGFGAVTGADVKKARLKAAERKSNKVVDYSAVVLALRTVGLPPDMTSDQVRDIDLAAMGRMYDLVNPKKFRAVLTPSEWDEMKKRHDSMNDSLKLLASWGSGRIVALTPAQERQQIIETNEAARFEDEITRQAAYVGKFEQEWASRAGDREEAEKFRREWLDVLQRKHREYSKALAEKRKTEEAHAAEIQREAIKYPSGGAFKPIGPMEVHTAKRREKKAREALRAALADQIAEIEKRVRDEHLTPWGESSDPYGLVAYRKQLASLRASAQASIRAEDKAARDAAFKLAIAAGKTKVAEKIDAHRAAMRKREMEKAIGQSIDVKAIRVEEAKAHTREILMVRKQRAEQAVVAEKDKATADRLARLRAIQERMKKAGSGTAGLGGLSGTSRSESFMDTFGGMFGR